MMELLSEKVNAHGVAISPDGTKIVSLSDQTIRVWDFGAPEPSNRPSFDKTDVCWLFWQAQWSC